MKSIYINFKQQNIFCRKFEKIYLPFGFEDQLKVLSNGAIECAFDQGSSICIFVCNSYKNLLVADNCIQNAKYMANNETEKMLLEKELIKDIMRFKQNDYSIRTTNFMTETSFTEEYMHAINSCKEKYNEAISKLEPINECPLSTKSSECCDKYEYSVFEGYDFPHQGDFHEEFGNQEVINCKRSILINLYTAFIS